jgi:hypothetical protein
MLSLGALEWGPLVMVDVFGWWWCFQQCVKYTAFKPNLLQYVDLSIDHVIVLIKS